MLELITFLSPPYYLILPGDVLSWIGWLVFLAIIILGMYFEKFNPLKLTDRRSTIFIVLLLSIFITTPMMGVAYTSSGSLPLPGVPDYPQVMHMMIFAALPWMIAAGILGVKPAVILAGISGLVYALASSHSIFTPLIFMFLALVFSICLQQKYRGKAYRFIRQPVVAYLISMLVFAPFLLICLLIAAGDVEASVKVNYAIQNFMPNYLSIALMTLTGSVVTQGVVIITMPRKQDVDGGEVPPEKKSLRYRFLISLLPAIALMLIILVISDWVIAEKSARGVLEERISSISRVTAEGIPYFLETGQNLLSHIGKHEIVHSSDQALITAYLAEEIRSLPYFEQLFYLTAEGELLTSYPPINTGMIHPTQEEMTAIQLANNGVQNQAYTIAPAPGEQSARLSFFYSIYDNQGMMTGILWGRTTLAFNPLSQPMLKSVDEVLRIQGNGKIIDERGVIIYDTVPENVMSTYDGELLSEPEFFTNIAGDGTRQIVYYQPTLGRPWSVVLAVPYKEVQAIAWQTALPFLIIAAIVFAVAFLVILYGLGMVSNTLNTLASATHAFVLGDFDADIEIKGSIGEANKLRLAFEEMRERLRARLDNQLRLLSVSHGVAGVQNLEETLQTVLAAALGKKLTSARIVLQSDILYEPVEEALLRLGMGSRTKLFAFLDHEILMLTKVSGKQQLLGDQVKASLKVADGMPCPQTVISIPLQLDDQYPGILWLAYDEQYLPTEDDLRFFEELAERATILVINARLYTEAEIGRKRMESVLGSLPDPVLMTDHRGRLTFTNNAARSLPGFGGVSLTGRPLKAVFREKVLLDMFEEAKVQPQSMEYEMSNGYTYQILATMVIVDNRRMGMVCVFRDITKYKELDTLKSEFVATVSHDLRSPLTLMRGYVTMLQMIGNLSEQQQTYVKRIISGVESMSNLVNNLLDIGRLETGGAIQISVAPVEDVVHQVVGSLEMQAQQKNIKVKVDLPEDTKIVLQADIALLQQALYNLVDNAIKYTSLGGAVEIKVQRKNARVLFIVKDNGIGIAPLDQPRLYEKFYRSRSNVNDSNKGTGLGLAIVKSIVDRHNGKLFLKSHLGKGSTFSMEIPLEQPNTIILDAKKKVQEQNSSGGAK